MLRGSGSMGAACCWARVFMFEPEECTLGVGDRHCVQVCSKLTQLRSRNFDTVALVLQKQVQRGALA